MTRRQQVQSLMAGLLTRTAGNALYAQHGTPAYGIATLPPGIRSRSLAGINGLLVHILEAGYESSGRPCVLLLHGFPELAYSWRKVMLPLAAAGYHVVAPDQRGYGQTTGWDPRYDGEVESFRLLNICRDAFGLVSALGYRSVAAVVGHDFGSPVAAWCSLLRPDVFRSVVLMSAPFAGPPDLRAGSRGDDMDDRLASLPVPRKHYQRYYSTRDANLNMWKCPQGVKAFLRAYYHHKSADWKGNRPHPLGSWTAAELSKMPTYYIMELAKGMAETVASHMPSRAEMAACKWLTDTELEVYSSEYERTGFQGGLNWYRCRFDPRQAAELEMYSGRTIDVPSCYIAGRSDWGIYQVPAAADKMRASACSRMLGFHLIDGAGHWAQQEQPKPVAKLLVEFIHQARRFTA